MESRRNRVQEKRTNRKGIFFLFLTIILILLFFIFGIKALIKVTTIATNLKGESTSQVADKTPPGPPQFENVKLKIALVPSYTIQARAEANSIVKIYQSSESNPETYEASKEVKIGDSARFETNVNLDKGENLFYLTSTDASGNESGRSSGLIVIFDLDAPTLDVTIPQDNQDFFGTDAEITIEGTTEGSAKVNVNDRVAIVNTDGKFSTRLTLSEGKNEIKIIATDRAENKTEKIITVTYSP